MDIWYNIKWMFFGSIVIGVFLNGMNVLLNSPKDFFISRTLIYIALFMASNMVILEILMHYNPKDSIYPKLLIVFVIFSVLIAVFLRYQFLINDEQWLKRMISHHSTAITTSKKIRERTQNEEVKKLADNIIITQLQEIETMNNLLKKLNN